MNATINYSPQVDAHVYGVKDEDGCQTPNDWIQLAMAALDQAGLSKSRQETIKARIDELAKIEGIL